MKVFRSLEEAHGQFGPAAIAIGNFDGVHLGHRKLISVMSEYAALHGLRKGVITFHPHPTVLIAPDRVPPMLCTLAERIERLAALDVERILVLPFTEELSRLTPDQFVDEILLHALQTKATFVGENFHFGYRQSGTPDVLRSLSRQFNFTAEFVRPVTWRAVTISSSEIRQSLLNHRLSLAGHMLGRCFSVAGPILKGQGIGTKQTVPTLNILPVPNQIVLPGVYITKTTCLASRRIWPSITNVGDRPTFNGKGTTIETYLLAPLEGQSPDNIQVEFRRFVRPERAFDNPESLKHQILKDVGRAQAYWRRVSIY